MIRRGSLILLWLALPVWGQMDMDDETVYLPPAHMAASGVTAFDTTVPYEWVTVEVDSANVGVDSTACKVEGLRIPCPDGRQDCLVLHRGPPRHGWVFGPFYCRESLPGPGDYEIVSSPPCLPGADLRRDRICRHCLRHEWQVRREVPLPPNPYDSLKARLK